MTTIGAALLGGAWLWGKFGDKVTERAGKLLGDAGRRAYEKIDWQAAAERYRGEMQMRYGTMRIIGMAEPVALADIFTDVFLLDKPSAWRRYNIEELKRLAQIEGQQSQRRDERCEALDLVGRHERLMILGKPGAGKTTLLKHLVLQCTTGKLNAVPIFVGLKAWSDSGLALMAFLTQQFAICAFPNAQPFIEHILAEGRAMVLFDGLDEVNLEQGIRERITREVRDLADQYPRSRCVITCRTAASDYQFERFAYCELADFTENQMRTFIAQWFQRDEAKRAAFLAEFVKPEHERLRDLARTPLLLTLLCLTFEETMTFPLRRAEIYEEALDALLKKWDASRSIKRDTVYRTLSLSHKRQMLARIAAETFAQNELFMRQGDLMRWIVAYLAKLPQASVAEEIDGEAILRSIEAQHGLLIERARRIYSFSHLTFHEYFTARYTVEHPSRQMFDSVVAHAHEAHWREVLLLTASMLDHENAETFFLSFDNSLRSIIHTPDIQRLFSWINRKSLLQDSRNILAWRLSYLGLALISTMVEPLCENAQVRTLDYPSDRLFASALIIARFSNSDVVDFLDLIRTEILLLSRTLARTGMHKLAHRLARTLGLAFAKSISATVRVSPYISDDAQSLGLYSAAILFAKFPPQEDTYNIVQRIWSQYLVRQKLCSNDQQSLYDTLLLVPLPHQGSSSEEWLTFATHLRMALISFCDIGHTWTLDTTQLEQLADYLEASTRMLECLDLAAVADRDAIRNRLLLPPQP